MDPKQFKELLKDELKPIIKKLDQHSEKLDQHSEKLDSISAELHEVHKLADMTHDIVKARYEKNKREINEIKDNLGLPKEPYFGETS